MRNLKTILIYTMKESICKKSFIISNIIMFAIIIVMFNVPNIIEKTKSTEDNKILIVDSQNIFENTLTSLNNTGLGYDFQIDNSLINEENIKTKIENKEIIAGIILSEENAQIKYDYIVKEVGKGPEPKILQSNISQAYLNLQVSKLTLTAEQINNLNMQIQYETKTVTGEEAPEFSFAIIIISIALFFAIYYYAYQVSASITMEKTSRVMETLITSTDPKSIILGKTIGTGLLGLLQFLALTIVSVICYKVFAEGQTAVNFLDFSQISTISLIIAFVYFILGYALYAFMYALVGSTVNKPEDIQSANTPVAMISLLGFYFGYFTVLFAPTSPITKIASLVPFSAPFSMPFRMMMTNVNTGEIIASIAILLITILLIIKISVKIYSVAVLQYGNKIGLKELFKLYKN